jgi:hypothetical protein
MLGACHEYNKELRLDLAKPKHPKTNHENTEGENTKGTSLVPFIFYSCFPSFVLS